MGKEGRDSEAEVYFRSAVAANPRYEAAWINLAATLASESRFPEARSAVESALRVNPNNADALRLIQLLPASSAGGQADHLPVRNNKIEPTPDGQKQ